MSAYTETLDIEPTKIGGVWGWRLGAPLQWEAGFKGSGLVVTVPAGFATDLATIPRWARWLFNPDAPDTAKAAALHDYLLSVGWEQRAAAGEFYAAMASDGVPLARRVIYFLAVVAGSDRW